MGGEVHPSVKSAAQGSLGNCLLSADCVAAVFNIQPIIENSLPTAEGIAVDWIGGNIYWVSRFCGFSFATKLNKSAWSVDRWRALLIR